MSTRSKSGSALLTVLWLTAALSAIGLAVASNVRGETERTATSVDDTKAYFTARGAIERAVLHILWRGYADDAGQPIYYRAGQPAMNLEFPGGQAEVDIIPESSKLNVNSISPDNLLRLLTALGVPIDRATEITSAILDWRKPVDPLHVSPFDSFYLSQSPSFLPRHSSYQENEELMLTKGITPGLYYGESARQATLQAVGLSQEDALALVARRTARPIADYRELSEIQQALGPSGQHLLLGGQTMYTLRATARLRLPDGKLSDMRRTIAALVHIDFPGNAKGRPAGYQVIRWFDRT